jgi:hypothetical protein
MFAFFNLGAQELLILLVGGVLCTGITAGVVVLVVMLTREKNEPRND